MENTKKNNIIKIIGLIALTILVVVGIIVTVYFVEKNNQSPTRISINEVGSSRNYDFKVTNIHFNSEGMESGYTLLSIDVSMTAKKNIEIEKSNFSLNDYEINSVSSFPSNIDKGSTKNFVLKYIVKIENVELFLEYDLYKVALGTSITA